MRYLLLSLLLFSNTVSAATLYFDPPTETLDGSPYIHRGEYRLDCGALPGIYDGPTFSETDTGQDTMIVGPPIGDWYCAMVAINSFGEPSVYSNELLVEIRPAAPLPPAFLRF